MSRPVFALLLLALLTFFVGLGRPAITDTDEGFYAEASREMVESGDWLTPHFNYQDRWQKPVLYYWVTAATYLVTGPTEWGARFFSALSGIGLVLLTWVAARRLTAREDVAFTAGAVVATCYGYFAIARLALPDLPLTLFITWTIWAGLERRWLIAGVAAGLGFLTKGPVGIVIPAIVLLPIWWRERSWPTLRDLALAVVAGAIIGLPWYIAMYLAHGSAYLESFFVGDNLERFATTRFNGPRFLLYYVPIIVGGLIPWAMYLLVLPWNHVRAVVSRRERLTPEEWRLVIWAAVPFVFYTVAIGKQPRYVLPVLPPLAILLARSIVTRIVPGDARDSRGLTVATWLTAGLFAAIALLLFRARPLFITAYPSLTIAAIAAVLACAATLGWIASSQKWTMLPSTLAASSVVFMLAVQFGALSGVRPEPVEEIADLIRQHRSAEPIGEYQVFVRNLTFYSGVRQSELLTDGMVLDFLKASDRVLLVIKERDFDRLSIIAGVPLRTLGSVRYVDPATIRLRTLLAPLPEQDIETVLLVTNR